MPKTKNIVLTSEQVTERGQTLLMRLRLQGIWQYGRWFNEVSGRFNGNASIQDRMYRIFNGKGTPLDTNLLLELEEIADKHLEQ